MHARSRACDRGRLRKRISSLHLPNQCPSILADRSQTSIDELFESYQPPTEPKKRSAAARSSRLAFLSELTEEQMQTYSPEQITSILSQRANVRKLKSYPSGSCYHAILFIISAQWFKDSSTTDVAQILNVAGGVDPNTARGRSPKRTGSSARSGSPMKISLISTAPKRKQSYVPTQECQFKCCHTCRPSMVDRSYLSLNGIADDDIPLTAVTGFGFQFLGGRPISLVKHVANLGLRPNPELPKPKMVSMASVTANVRKAKIAHIKQSSPMPFFRRRDWHHVDSMPSLSDPSMMVEPLRPTAITKASPSPFNDEANADTTFGQDSNAYDSTSMTRIHNAEFQTRGLGLAYTHPERKRIREFLKEKQEEQRKRGKHLDHGHDDFSLMPDIRPADTPPNTPQFAHNDIATKKVLSNNPGRRYVKLVLHGDQISNALTNSDKSLRVNKDLRSKFNLDEVRDEVDHNVPVLKSFHAYASDPPDNLIDTDEPMQGINIADASTRMMASATMMELDEVLRNEFGSAPLQVGSGVALMEESVAVHEPDIMTQV
jgi:hypothetical protein